MIIFCDNQSTWIWLGARTPLIWLYLSVNLLIIEKTTNAIRILQARWPWRRLGRFYKVFWKNLKAARATAACCTAVATQSTVSLATPSSSSGGASLAVSLAAGDMALKWFTVALTSTLFTLWLWGWQDTAGVGRSEEKWPRKKKKKKTLTLWPNDLHFLNE